MWSVLELTWEVIVNLFDGSLTFAPSTMHSGALDLVGSLDITTMDYYYIHILPCSLIHGLQLIYSTNY